MDQNYMIMGFSLIFITIALAILLILFFLTTEKKPILYDDETQTIAVIDIIELLRRICPVGLERKWVLLLQNYAPVRCWFRQLPFPILNANIKLYASSMAMNCSVLQLLHLIADVSQWGEWEPSDSSFSFHARPLLDGQLKKDNFMRADQIECVSKDANFQSTPVLFRFLYLTKDDTGCVLLWNTKKMDFKFFLVQRCTAGNSDTECCLVTHIEGLHEATKHQDIASLVVQRLRNMNDSIHISSLNVTTFNFLSTLPLSHMFSQAACDSPVVEEKPVPKIFKLSPTACFLKNEVPLVFILTPFSYYMNCTVWNLKGFHIRVQKLSDDSLFLKKIVKKTSTPNSPKKKTADSKDRCSPKFSKSVPLNLKRTSSDFDAAKISNQSAASNANPAAVLGRRRSTGQGNKNVNCEEKHVAAINSNASQRRITLIKRESKELSVHSDIEIKKSGLSIGKSKSASETILSTCYGNKDDSFEGKFCSRTDCSEEDSCFHSNEKVNMSDSDDVLKLKPIPTSGSSARLSEFEFILPYEEISDNKIADFVTQGNYCASELQAELLQVSSINLQCSVEDQKLSCCGWMYHSTHKGIVVLTKVSSSGYLRTVSYMCETILPVPSKDVWKLVMNPRSRFICDETVKKVRILEYLPKGQKIIHTYHESSSLLKKEAVDFCLLHTEREEKNKFYLTFHSVDYENCPLMDSITRGMLRPSGWVIQELQDPKKCKVTYLIQILINSPDSMLIQELGVLVPASMYNLTNFLVLKPL